MLLHHAHDVRAQVVEVEPRQGDFANLVGPGAVRTATSSPVRLGLDRNLGILEM
jgi:hypothetical protein